MNVLSLFDGISCGHLALDSAGILVDTYCASEVNAKAISVTQHNYPNTKQLGNVKDWRTWGLDFSKIDLLIGGPPCQSFSVAGRKGKFEDPRGQLLFDYIDIYNEIHRQNPNVKFIMENVKMTDDIVEIVDTNLGVSKVLLDSRHFSGMIRKRYYWTNIPIAPVVEKDMKLRDLIGSAPFDKDLDFYLSRTKYEPTTSYDGIITINPRDNKGKQTWQRGRVYDISGACPTICATLFDLNITQDHKTYRKLTIEECERLQDVPTGYTSILSTNERGRTLGNGWTVSVIAHILKGLCVNDAEGKK